MQNFIEKIMIGVWYCFASVLAAPSIWDGSADISWYNAGAQSYNISTAEQLAGLAKLVNDGTSDFLGATFTLAADIFLNDTTGAGNGTWGDKSHKNWIPIGTANYPFKGEFDGIAGKKKHKIYGLYVNTTSADYVGLFGNASNIKISNLDVVIGNISGKDGVGAVVGYANGGAITNVHVEVDVNGNNHVGGLVGYFTGNISKSSGKGDVVGQDSVGGLVGYTNGSISGTSTENSYFAGNVRGRMYVGGAVGVSNKYYAAILNMYVEANVLGDSSFVGGIVGYANGTINTTYHIDGEIRGFDYVGGVAGLTRDSVKNSYSEGIVVGRGSSIGGVVGAAHGVIDSSYHIDGDVIGFSCVGGLVGYASQGVKNSYSEGNVLGADSVGGLAGFAARIEKSYHIGGYVSGYRWVGGLAGYVGGLCGTNVPVNKSYSMGIVKGSGSYVGGLFGAAHCPIVDSYSEGAVVGSGNYVGGLVGQIDESIDNSYSNGDVSSTGNYVGGLIGRFFSYNPSSSESYIKDSYHLGNVKGVNYVGGLIGVDSVFDARNYHYHTRTIENNFTSGSVQGVNFVGGLIGRQIDSVGSGLIFLFRQCYHKDGAIKADSNYVGGLVGYSVSGMGSSYHLNGDINGLSYVGGLAGYVEESIANSYSEGNVSGLGNNVGGLIGYAKEMPKNSYSVGNVSGVDTVGGLAGFAVGVDNSYSQGSVLGRDYVGGLVGVGSGIKSSYAVGKFIKGRNVVGGLVGHANYIRKSYFYGDSVMGLFQVGGLAGCASTIDSSYSTANVKGDENVGGLVGSAYRSISNSYATGNVVGDEEHSSAGNDNLGGLVGYQYGGTVSKSLAVGNVSGTTKLGGLVGRFDGTSISQSYANGNVTGNYYGNPADEVGNYYIGGLVGYAKGSLIETYASGVVKGIEGESVYTGCIVGYVNVSLSVSESYYDKTKCDLGVDGEENAANVSGTPGRTTAEMQNQSTFADWNFTNVWRIEDNTYPFLRMFANLLINSVVSTESLDGMTYDGFPKTPQVLRVSLLGDVLTENVDYTVKYEKNVNVGTAKIIVCGINLYSGCKYVEFEIAPMSINPTVSAIENMTYTGVSLTPGIFVYNGESLLDASNYTVEYANNLNVGTASVTVTMKDNYVGSATANFTIEKATPVISQNPKASDVLIDEALASSDLSGGTSDVEGVFVWKSPEIKPTLENEGYAVEFIPTDANNYNSVEFIIPIKVWDVAYVAVHLGKTTLDSIVVIKGNTYTLPMVPDSVGYDFVGFYNGKSKVGDPGDEIIVNENTVVDAVYVKTFVVKFVNGNIDLQSEELAYGSIPQYKGDTPVMNSTARWTYSFKGWDPAVASVTGPATYTATFDGIENKYVVSFMNGDTELQFEELAYGRLPIYRGGTPVKNATAQWIYTFKGWNPEIVPVVEPAAYTAVFDSALNKYEVAFKDYDGSILKTAVQYDYGTSSAEIVQPEKPVRHETAKYTYSFKGWNPPLTNVTEDAVYTAEYDSTVRSYQVVFVNGEKELQSGFVAYGEVPIYNGIIPTKKATTQWTYTFKGWNPEIVPVVVSATYSALFDSALNKYEVAFKDYDGTILKAAAQYDYGTSSAEIVQPEKPVRRENAKCIYTFKGWTPIFADVTENVTYVAEYDSSLQSYQVVYVNGKDVLQSESVFYGVLPFYLGDKPTKEATDSCTYKFSGWSPKEVSVTENVTYTAVFKEIRKEFIINFKNGDFVLDRDVVAYGDIPTYTGALPTKKSTKKYSYEFVGWKPEIGPAVRAVNYVAVFDSTDLTRVNKTVKTDMSISVVSRLVQISAAQIGSVYAILDMQGCVLKKGRVESPNFNVMMPQAGTYFVRIGNDTQRISVK